jgi:hypothetical protein
LTWLDIMMVAGWHCGDATMERPTIPRPSGASSTLLGVTAGFLGLLALSLTFQPPYHPEADSVERLMGWLRAGLLTAGAAAFLLGLIFAMRNGDSPIPYRRSVVPMPPRPRRSAAFTLVALGGTPDDTRAIADAADAAEAVRVLWEWSDLHPDEHVVVFNAEAEAVAFKRPVWTGSTMRRA